MTLRIATGGSLIRRAIPYEKLIPVLPHCLSVHMTELKLQLAEVLVALAKAVYDLSAVGAALTPHNLENLQMCRDLLHGDRKSVV